MPTDESIAAIYKRLSDYCQIDRSISQWGVMLLFGMSYICLQIFQLIGISHTTKILPKTPRGQIEIIKYRDSLVNN